MEGKPFNSQEYFCEQAYGDARALPGLKAPEKLRPTAKPAPKPIPKPMPAAPKKPAPSAAPTAQKRPTVRIQTRRTGLLGRIFGRD